MQPFDTIPAHQNRPPHPQQQARHRPMGHGTSAPLTEAQYLNASLALMAKLKAKMCARAASQNHSHFCQ